MDEVPPELFLLARKRPWADLSRIFRRLGLLWSAPTLSLLVVSFSKHLCTLDAPVDGGAISVVLLTYIPGETGLVSARRFLQNTTMASFARAAETRPLRHSTWDSNT